MSIHVKGFLDGKPIIYAPTEGLYSDGTPYVKGLPPEEMEIEAVVIKTTTLQGLWAGVDYASAVSTIVWNRGQVPPDLYVPYLPGARQDRRNLFGGDVLNTASRSIQIVNSARPLFESIYVFDVHNPSTVPEGWNVVPANIIGNAVTLGNWPKHELYYDAVIAPDKGAVARAQGVANLFHVPLLVASKVRDVSDGRITSYSIDTSTSEMRRVLVVDDLCDGGYTFELLAKSLPADSIKDLYVTHGLFSKGTKTLRKLYDNIITTDSVYSESGLGIHVLNLLPGVN
jgi:phosphoribosylpyrophosphate synthetase